MGRQLSEMTLEELWQLFPIILTEHRDEWEAWFREERERLIPLLPEGSAISHIGSTAIRGIWAKPIVDILAELPNGAELPAAAETLAANGYIVMSRAEDRISLNRGYTPQGFAERVFHLHLRYAGDNDEIRFCDYLNGHPEDAKEYEKLKLALWKEYEHDRDGYTRAKSDFVAGIMRRAERKTGR